MHKPVTIVILAAGLGTRMQSRQAKVLHKAGGKTDLVAAGRSQGVTLRIEILIPGRNTSVTHLHPGTVT